MSLDCKALFSNCIVCNHAKPNRQGSSSLFLLRAPEYTWGIVGMDFVIDFTIRSKFHFTTILVFICHFTKWHIFFRGTRSHR